MAGLVVCSALETIFLKINTNKKGYQAGEVSKSKARNLKTTETNLSANPQNPKRAAKKDKGQHENKQVETTTLTVVSILRPMLEAGAGCTIRYTAAEAESNKKIKSKAPSKNGFEHTHSITKTRNLYSSVMVSCGMKGKIYTTMDSVVDNAGKVNPKRMS